MSTLQYVVFTLGEAEYGIDIACVQEIIRIPQQITQIPNTPPYVEGIINLRGKIIPIIDLKQRFGLEQSLRGADHRLLVLNLDNMLVGTIVDDVSEVLMIDHESMETLHSGISQISSNSVAGVGKVDERLILCLDALQLKSEAFQKLN